MRKLMPWTPHRNLRLLADNGLPGSSDFDERMVVNAHFRKTLKTVDCDYGDIIQQIRDSAFDVAVEHVAVQHSLNSIPPLAFITVKHDKAKMRGCGELASGGEVKRLVPQTLARLAHPLHAKSALNKRLPVQFLGGTLQELWKRIGDQYIIANFRDSTLSDGDGKDLQSFIRMSTFVAVTLIAGDCQMGAGLNGGATDACRLGVAQCFSLARTKGVSMGIVFIDIVCAFASISRRLSMQYVPNPKPNGWYIFAIGFAADEAAAILESALPFVNGCMFGATEHSVALLTATHAASCFSIDGLRVVSNLTRRRDLHNFSGSYL